MSEPLPFGGRVPHSKRYLVVPPVCPDCHQHGLIYWADATDIGDPETFVVPGKTYCNTEGCPRRDGRY